MAVIINLFFAASPSFSVEFLKIGGKPVRFEDSILQIVDGRLFVQSDLANALGAEVSYEKEKGHVRIRLNDEILFLDLRERILKFSGREIEYSLIKVIEKHLFLSDSIYEMFGYRIDYDYINGLRKVVPLINSFEYDDAAQTLEIKGAGRLTLDKTVEREANRILLFLPDSFVRPEFARIYSFVKGDLKGLTVQPRGSGTEFILDMKKVLGVKSYISQDGRLVTVKFGNYFLGMERWVQETGEIALRMTFSDKTTFESFTMDNPKRLVVDFDDVIYDEETIKEEISTGRVDRLRLAQFSRGPNRLRLVVELNRGTAFRIIPSRGHTEYVIQIMEPAPLKFGVLLDAGHGGSDPGAKSVMGYFEKDVNLNVTRILYSILLERGYDVEMTRDGDYFVTLLERSQKANSDLPHIFVSIHSNAINKIHYRGAMSFYFQGSIEGYRLAESTLNGLIARTGAENLGVRTANFFVLRETIVPATLIEIGFLTNREEAIMLEDVSYQRRIAEGIADGIDNYFAALQIPQF